MHSHGESPQAAGAGRIDHAIGAAQVQTVGDAPGDDVAQEARKRALGPRRVRVGDTLADLLNLAFGQAALSEGLHPVGLLDLGRHLSDEFRRRGNAQDHTDILAVYLVELHADGIVQNLLGDDQGQQLYGIRR